jgi:hypothetical protein
MIDTVSAAYRRERPPGQGAASNSPSATGLGWWVDGMIRFLVGVLIGGSVMYWYLTGNIPWRDRVEGWFARTASSYTSERHRSEADQLIREQKPARTP